MPSHPYISGAGNVEQMIGFLRKNFPASVTSETVKKFSLAPNNESFVINALQFIGVIDEEGRRTEKGQNVFVLSDPDFAKGFEDLIKEAYGDLFEVRGEDSWQLSRQELVSYFRATDKTSEVIGGRQAHLFQVFAALAGRSGEEVKVGATSVTSQTKAKGSKSKITKTKSSSNPASANYQGGHSQNDNRKDMALTVRIEINLPANATQEAYDMIFKSIRANLYT